MGTLYFGGTIYTMNDEKDTIEAVYTADGKIVAVGDKHELEAEYREQITEYINLKGKVMYPGFVDSHLHIIGHGEKLLRLDLSKCDSSREMAESLKQKVKETKHGEWIFGEGWNENRFVDRKIFHRSELDEISPHHPMVLTRICRHALLANSAALTLAGITAATPDPPGGVIVKDGNGEPTGFLLDTAQELVKNAIPAVTPQYLRRALKTSVQDLIKKGLTGGHSEDLNYYGGFARTYDAFKDVINEDEISFRADLLVHHEVIDDMEAAGYGYKTGTKFVRFCAMKIFADGALGGRTALLSHPYTDAPETSGVAVHSKQELYKLVKRARAAKMPVAIHTIGDLALQYAIEAIEANPPLPSQRDRLVHGQILTDALIEKLKRLPVIIDIQPLFVLSDFPWVIERLGEERMKLSYAWKTMLNEGLLCAGGSDAPIEDVDPLLGIYAAVNRKQPEHSTVFSASEKLTVFEAVKLYTVGSALAVCEENQRGYIRAGYHADFTVFDRDLFQLEGEQLLKAEVAMTIVNGKLQYIKPNL